MVSLFEVSGQRSSERERRSADFRAGFNVLLHGVGSKKPLLTLFYKKYLKNEFLTFVIHGFMPNINIKQVKTKSREDRASTDSFFRFCKPSAHRRRSTSTCRTITTNVFRRFFNVSKRKVKRQRRCLRRSVRLELHIYLLINNIDGMNFRNNHVQNIFKLAAQSKYIHILATIDHIHASLSQ